MHSDFPANMNATPPSSDARTDDATELQGSHVAAAADGGALEAGTRIGAFVILRRLGEGGMGRVYLAEQTQPVRREVALKLLREQFSSPLALAYFDVERQALAQMQHPAIAQVFDAGTTPDGRPYLAMEVVEGKPITQFCREAGLDLAQRLSLFARVCHGVQHAHQKGIIHRDLKPANVLVRDIDGEPMPTIIDFGIAIADGGGSGALTAETAGTAVYMSPEQNRRDGQRLDTRSDVYSLGVMLFEVLTDSDVIALGSSAHLSGHPAALLFERLDSQRSKAAQAPAGGDLVQATQSLPRELRAVLRKALAPRREDRYASAAALADDLDRFRARRPLQAMPPTRLYLASRFAARHRFGLAAAGLVALALLAGIALAVHGMQLARQSETVARAEAAKSAQVSEFVRGMLAGIDPDHARGMDNQLLRTLLDAAAERADRELADQHDVHADIEATIADSYASIGEFERADAHYQAALAAAREAPSSQLQVADILRRRADALSRAGKPDQALAEANKALALVGDLPATDRLRLRVEHTLGALERETGKVEESRTRLKGVLERQTAALGADDADTLVTLQSLAISDTVGGNYAEARHLLQSLIGRYRRLRGPDDLRTVGATVTLAVLENEQENYPETVKLLTPVLPVIERIYGPAHPRTLVVVMNLGSALRYSGHLEEARPYYLRALETARQLYGPQAPRTLMAEGNLSLMLRDAGDLAAAEQHARFVVEHADQAFGDNPYRAAMLRGLASILILERKFDEAESLLDRAWSLFAEAPSYGPEHPRTQEVVDSGIELYTAWKKPARLATWQARKVAPPADKSNAS